MKKEIIYCDICGAEGARTCNFYVDRSMDGAGSMDDEYKSLDLCELHIWDAYKMAEKKGGRELGAHVYSTLYAHRIRNFAS